MIVKKVKEVYKVLLRNCASYDDLLKLMKDFDVPKERVAFIDYMCNMFYTDEDFYALLALIQKNLMEYDEKEPREVLLHIFEKMHSDYINYLV